MDLSLFKSYEQSVLNYDKAKFLLDKAEQQKNNNFQAVLKYLQPFVIKELTAIDEIDEYYLTGEGQIVVINFVLKEHSISVMYGFLAEDDIFPNKTNSLELHLFNF